MVTRRRQAVATQANNAMASALHSRQLFSAKLEDVDALRGRICHIECELVRARSERRRDVEHGTPLGRARVAGRDVLVWGGAVDGIEGLDGFSGGDNAVDSDLRT